MTREAASVSRAVLGADWQRNQNENQRNRGEVLHKDILRPNAKCALVIRTVFETQPVMP
jgi:hypothetical protein